MTIVPLVEGIYAPIRVESDGTLYSREMQLGVKEIDGTLRLVNPAKNEALKTYSEAEEENRRLRAELEQLRGKQG